MNWKIRGTSGRLIILAVTSCHLLTASWNVAADDSDPVAAPQAALESSPQTPDAASRDGRMLDLRDAGMLSFLVPGMSWLAWPLAVGVLALAAINSRKRRPRQQTRHGRRPS